MGRSEDGNIRTWFVTGSSRGLGAALVSEILDRGDRVVATARRPEKVIERFGDQERLLAVRLDVTQERQAFDAVAAALARFGVIDVLVNNAGYGLVGTVEEVSDVEARAVFDTNLFGLLNVTRAALPHLRHQGRGHIVNIGSMGGLAGLAGVGIYSATKFAVEGLTEALSKEVRALGITVTVVEPGQLRTDFLAKDAAVFAEKRVDVYNDGPAGAMRAFHSEAHGTQLGDPQKAARVIVELVDSEDAPIRLPLGEDAVTLLERRLRATARALGPWRDRAVAIAYEEHSPSPPAARA